MVTSYLAPSYISSPSSPSPLHCNLSPTTTYTTATTTPPLSPSHIRLPFKNHLRPTSFQPPAATTKQSPLSPLPVTTSTFLPLPPLQPPSHSYCRILHPQLPPHQPSRSHLSSTTAQHPLSPIHSTFISDLSTFYVATAFIITVASPPSTTVFTPSSTHHKRPLRPSQHLHSNTSSSTAPLLHSSVSPFPRSLISSRRATVTYSANTTHTTIAFLRPTSFIHLQPPSSSPFPPPPGVFPLFSPLLLMLLPPLKTSQFSTTTNIPLSRPPDSTSPFRSPASPFPFP